MILILSENKDFTTNEVIKWLHIFDKKYIRVHEFELFEIKVIDKLFILEKAVAVGLDVPYYFLSDTTDGINVEKTITKSISENIIVKSAFEGFDGILYTSVIEKQENEVFFPTFFQEKIEKEFEIRCFYLNGKIWSCAIFSQNDEQTKIDSRIYNYEKPNRNLRYTLPIEIQNKICILMNKLDYNCGSIDFIKSVDGKYYFLEVNPVGQFLGISDICNYSLEKEIADYL